MIRGIYSAGDERDEAFRTVATFETAAECKAWYAKHQACTNPSYPQCRQIYTHLCDWDQVCKHLLEPLAELRRAEPFRGPAAPLPPSNVFLSRPEIVRELTARLDLPFHARVSEESTLNTLRYLFFHMRCGIFVAIRGGRLRMFVPFVNKDYRNTWGAAMRLEDGGSVEDYVAKKRGLLGSKEEYILDPSRWWANGNIICNVESPDFWGDNYLPQLRHMLETLCARRAVPDAEFFINKRDFPHLTRDLTEPYAFIYDSPSPPPLARERYSTYAPIASFFVGSEFADLPLVSTDDWESATGRVFPPNATDLRSAANRRWARGAGRIGCLQPHFTRGLSSAALTRNPGPAACRRLFSAAMRRVLGLTRRRTSASSSHRQPRSGAGSMTGYVCEGGEVRTGRSLHQEPPFLRRPSHRWMATLTSTRAWSLGTRCGIARSRGAR